jgi:hypothetical protein
MKKLLLAGAGLFLAGLALPAFVPRQAPTGDSGFGSGHVLETNFAGSGQSGPNGETPVGSLTLRGYLNFTAIAAHQDFRGRRWRSRCGCGVQDDCSAR